MSQLSDKILSYAVEKYAPWSGAVATNTSPQYGTYTALSLPINLTNQANITADTSGPIGGTQNSWKWTNPGALTTFASINGYGTTGQPLADNDYSIGFWFKINQYNANATSPIRIFSMNVANNSSPGFFLMLDGTNANNRLKVTPQGQTSLYITAAAPDLNRWYYFAAIRTPGDQTTRFYLDGTLVLSRTWTPGLFTISNVGFGMYNTTNPAYSFNIAHPYMATSSVINATAISEIWTAGSTAPVSGAPLKYWNGTAWTTPLSITQWNGSAWTTFNGKVWDGSAWIEIT